MIFVGCCGILSIPFIWSVLEALITVELETMFSENGGYVVWVSAALGDYYGGVGGCGQGKGVVRYGSAERWQWGGGILIFLLIFFFVISFNLFFFLLLPTKSGHHLHYNIHG